MKNLLIVLLALGCVALALRRAPTPADPPAPQDADPVEKVAVSDPAVGALERELARLRAENTRLEKELRERVAVAAPPSRTVVRSITNAIRMNASPDATNLVRDIMSEVQKALSGQLGGAGLLAPSAAQAAETYGTLLDRLGITGQKRSDVLEALKGVPSIFRIGDLEKLPENESLRSLLAPAEYNAWQTFEQSIPYREAVSDFAQRLTGSGAGLSDAQRDQLARIFQENRITRATRIQFGSGTGTDSPDQALDSNYREWDAVVESSRAVLNTAQREELDRYLGQRADEAERLARTVSIQDLSGVHGSGVVQSVQIISSGAILSEPSTTPGISIKVQGAAVEAE